MNATTCDLDDKVHSFISAITPELFSALPEGVLRLSSDFNDFWNGAVHGSPSPLDNTRLLWRALNWCRGKRFAIELTTAPDSDALLHLWIRKHSDDRKVVGDLLHSLDHESRIVIGVFDQDGYDISNHSWNSVYKAWIREDVEAVVRDLVARLAVLLPGQVSQLTE